MSELYGYAAGLRQSNQDTAQKQLQQLAVKQGNQNLLKGEQDMQTETLTQKEKELKIRESQSALDRQKMFLDNLKNKPPSSGEEADSNPYEMQASKTNDMASELERFAAAASQTEPDKAAEYLSKASLIRKNAQEISKNVLEQNLKRAEVAQQVLQMVKETLPEERKQAWQQANAMFELKTGERSQFGSLPYSDELLEGLTSKVLDEKTKAEVERDKAAARASDASAATSRARQPLISAQTRLADARAVALEKAGVKTNPEDLRAISDNILGTYGKGISKEQARTVGRNILERAQDLMKANGLDKQAAIDKALTEEKQTGDLKGIEPGDVADRRDALGQIDGLIDKLKKNPSLGGATGQIRRGAENAGTLLSLTQKSPANTFDAQVQSLLLKLPKLLTGSSKSAKDERARVEKLIKNQMNLGVGQVEVGSGQTMLEKLQALRSELKGDKKPSAQIPALGSKNTKGWTLMKDKSGSYAYVSPDGKKFEEYIVPEMSGDTEGGEE